MIRTVPTRESLEVEFKSDRRRLSDDELVLAAVCLANTEGGQLYLGVEDDGTLSGLHAQRPSPEGVVALIANRTVPSLSVRASLLEEQGVRIALFEVPKARSVVATTNGVTQRRRLMADGSPGCVPFLPHEFPSRQSDLGELDYSALPVRGATLEALDPRERERLRELHRRYGGDPSLKELSDEELDGALHLVRREGDRLVPTVTGLLLLGHERALEAHLPTHEVLFQVLSGTEVRVNEGYHGPLLRTFDAIEQQLRLRNEQTETRHGLFRVTIPTIDERAFREAVLNAIAHRDYARRGAVHIQWLDDTIDVSNPGGFVEGVTLDNLLVTQPMPRNPRLADALKRIGLVERSGRGVDLMYAGSLRYGRPAPDYSNTTANGVVVSLSHGRADVDFLQTILAEEKRLGAPISVSSLIVLAELRKSRRCKLTVLAAAMQQSESRARAVLERLVEAGLVDARGTGKGREYILGERVYRATGAAAGYQRQRGLDPAEQEAAVLAFITEHGRIRRAEVIALCKLTPDQATQLLSKLVKAGKLEKTGEKRGASYQRAGR